MRRTGVWVSAFRNSVIHQIFPEFLQQLRDLRTCATWVVTQQVSPFYLVIFVFIWFWILDRSFRSTCSLDTGTGWESIPLRSSLSGVSLSLDTVVVGEVDKLEEGEGWLRSCLEGVIDVEEWELDEELDDKPGTTIGTKFSVLHCVRIPFLICGFWQLIHSYECPFSSQSFPSGNTAGVFSRTFIVKNTSNSLTHTAASSCVCTSPLAVMTILHDFVQVSISAEFKSFLLIMCIDAPESTTNYLSSGLRFDAGRHLFSESLKNAALFLSINFRTHFWPTSTLLRGQLALATLSLPETDPQILEHWGYAHEGLLGKSFRPKDFGLECLRDVQQLSWILHIESVSVCLSSSVKSMKTSAAPCPEIRNPIVVYLMNDRIQRVSPF